MLVEDSYIVGSEPDDGFSYDRVGFAIARIGSSEEPPSRVWIDDVTIVAHRSPP